MNALSQFTTTTVLCVAVGSVLSGCSTLSPWDLRYTCLNEEATIGHTFTLGGYAVHIDHLEFNYPDFGTFDPLYQDPFTSKSKGGNYNVYDDDKKTIVRYLQGVALTKLQTPSGQLVEENDKTHWDMLYKGQHQYLIRYHAIYPMTQEYIFDKEELTLVLHTRTELPPTSFQKITFAWDSASGKVINQGSLPLDISLAEQYIDVSGHGVYNYPNCQQIGYFEGLINFWVSLTTSV